MLIRNLLKRLVSVYTTKRLDKLVYALMRNAYTSPLESFEKQQRKKVVEAIVVEARAKNAKVLDRSSGFA